MTPLEDLRRAIAPHRHRPRARAHPRGRGLWRATTTPGRRPTRRRPPSADALEGDIQVAAAASLTEAFDELAQMFEDDHPGVTVTTEFGPSSGLSDGILEGQPADVFASADEANMQKLVDGDAVDERAVQVFAANRPEIAVPAGNPGGVQGLDDFARDDLLVGLCAEDVPCGKFARTVLEEAGVVPADRHQRGRREGAPGQDRGGRPRRRDGVPHRCRGGRGRRSRASRSPRTRT